MKFDQLIVLLPCLSLEDFTLRRKPEEAEQLLAAYSALWHPALVHGSQVTPSWLPAETPPEELAGRVVIVPDCCVDSLPEGWLKSSQVAAGLVLDGPKNRREMVDILVEKLESEPDPIDLKRLDPDLTADFHALGFCHLIIELLTRQLRYMSNLDEESFRMALVSAAEHALDGNHEEGKGKLQAAFDLLHEAREYFYPVEAHLLDLTLVAPTTLGQPLRDQLAGPLPTNLLIDGHSLSIMAEKEPATFEALGKALEENGAALVGGEFVERPLPLLPPESILHHLRHGLSTYSDLLGRRPTIFGRRQFGLSPVLPGILKSLQFDGAIHCTLDDGKFPVGNQSRIQWEGVDSATIEALGKIPVDVSRADAFLALPERLGNSMDLDHVATVVLAHWPGQSSPWYEDIRRISAYCHAIGTFSTITDYFQETGFSGQQTRYSPDQYRSPYLTQAVRSGQTDPISRWVRYHARRSKIEAAQSLEMLVACGFAEPAESDSGQSTSWVDQIEDALFADTDPGEDFDASLQAELDANVARFAVAVAKSSHDDSAESGYLAANPSSFSRRFHIAIPDLAELPPVAGPVRAVGGLAEEKAALVDVPAMGFAWVGPGMPGADEPEPPKPKGLLGRFRKPAEPTPLAEENVLCNEFCKVTIDPSTGAIRSISDYQHRGARLAQQIALRTPQKGESDPGDDVHYSIMVADDIAVTSAGPLLGEIVCRGRLVDRQVQRLAGFTQRTRLRRGSRVIELQIDLQPDRQPTRDPWHSYYAARFAWGDAAASIYRSVSLANLPTDCAQLEAPHFIDIVGDNVRTTLLAGGLPYHRRFGLRKLDTLLMVRGETARSFRLGIGIDLPHPVPASLDFLGRPLAMSGVPAPAATTGWLFHLDARNVVATAWEALVENGRADGFRVRLLETDGRKVQLGLRACRAVRSAQKVDFAGTAGAELPLDDDRVTVLLGPHEWVEVEARFTK